MSHVHLSGADDVARAGSQIASAACDMQRAADTIAECINLLLVAMEQHQIVIERLAESLKARQGPSVVDPGRPSDGSIRCAWRALYTEYLAGRLDTRWQLEYMERARAHLVNLRGTGLSQFNIEEAAALLSTTPLSNEEADWLVSQTK